ncbi:MAG: UDP-N-acetylmuramate dehydrogenase [Burkholderiales bacterium]|nr:UDP-N-acetylmuramate dehydrogenase [Burkholderiales bacterium]
MNGEATRTGSAHRAGAHAAQATGNALRGELRYDEPMARHVSWRAGGTAERAYFPADLSDLEAFLRNLPDRDPVHFVGLGSNLLVRDGGLRGTVILTHRALRNIRIECDDATHGEIYVEAGTPAPQVARFAALHGLTGAEFLAGIPGTVGGALAMNAGCYGGETWGIVVRVDTLDRAGVFHQRTPAHYRIGYRSVKRRCRQIPAVPPARAVEKRDGLEEWFVAATFRLPHGDGEKSRLKIKELLSKRIASQPLQQANAGSVFRNPPGDHAARLIEACGLKGYRIGDAEISRKHANFIVNTGAARAGDIEALIEHMQDAVKRQFGIELEREVRIVGEK